MQKELLILRHAKAKRDADGGDYHRPLKNRGKRDAQRIGSWLSQHDCVPDQVLSSSAERARVTAEKCCKVTGIAANRIQLEPRLYAADRETLLAILADSAKEAHRLLLVGHNPGLDALLSYLVKDVLPVSSNGSRLATASLARLAMPQDWHDLQAGQATLLDLIHATSLPEKFPFPGPHGEEWRDRPAYYYTQSAIIPYRFNRERLEILIVRSSSNKHWVIPKGIADPGHSLQDSAAKEAWEEAGVEGDVMPQALGRYQYPKWGATCEVTVFAMAVTRQEPETAWEESHRGRQWVSAARAADLLKQQALAAMVRALEKQLLEV
jgi:phosphohistidine phosphatase